MSSLPGLARARVIALVWLGTLVLSPGAAGGGPIVDALLFFSWGLLLVAGSREGAAPLIGTLGAAAGMFAVWAIEPRVYLGSMLLLLGAFALGVIFGPRGSRFGRAAVFLVPAFFPALIGILSWALGDDGVHEVLRREWVFPPFAIDSISIFGRWLAIQTAAWMALAWGRRDLPRARIVMPVAAALLVVLAGWRIFTVASLATIPGDAQWSESPALMTLLAIDVGAPIFRPLADCNSYLYSPIPEIVHHALLRPFGLQLSLVANRVLVSVWQLSTAAILWLVVRSSKSFPGRLGAVGVAAFSIVVAGSNFLAPHLHPDHMLMPAFALALGLAIYRPALSPRVVTAALLLLPVMAALVKLTGAGVGLGLVLALARPSRRRDVGLLAIGGVLAIAALFVVGRLLPGFWTYTLGIQSSHPIRWNLTMDALFERPGRVAFAAASALGVALVTTWRAPDERVRAAGRAALVTAGFLLPSMIAYLKVGGRVNSLLPLSIGGSVVLLLLAARLAKRPEGRAIAGLTALWLGLTVTPAQAPVLGEYRREVIARHERGVSLLRTETASGRSVLFYEGMAVWIDAGRRDIPKDRPQTVAELMLGHHPEAAAHFERLADGTYDSIIISDRFLDPRRLPFADDVRTILYEHYDAMPDLAAMGTLSPFVVYRRRR